MSHTGNTGSRAVLTLLGTGLRYLAPRPLALTLRRMMERGAEITAEGMLPYVPASGVESRLDLPYRPGRANLTLDVHSPTGGEPHLTVIWIHGGAWVSGSKTHLAPYLQRLAATGYTTIGVNYSLAPEECYPAALHDLNQALNYVVRHADELGVDPARIVIAGDSAGAQLASQLATMITSPAYARLVRLTPGLDPAQLLGVVLHSGVYDLEAMARADGLNAWGFGIVLQAYADARDWASTGAAAQMSTLNHVTADFPATCISAGNTDPLTRSQSVPFAQRLRSLGVAVDPVFWDDHQRALSHQYQFDFALDEAHQTLFRTLAFLSALDPGPGTPHLRPELSTRPVEEHAAP